MNFSRLMEILPRIAMSLIPGVTLGTPAGGAVSRILGRAVKRRVPWMELTYPGLKHEFNYPIVYVGGDTPFFNASLNPQLAEKGALMQSLEEHNAALAEGGPMAEKALESWWTDDMQPRENFTPGSSAVSGVKITPDNKIQVQFRDGGKWYTYKGGNNPREASEAAKSLLTARSIGQALAHPKEYSSNIGWWGRNHYDASAVK